MFRYMGLILENGSLISFLRSMYFENLLENVQRRFTQGLPNMLSKVYDERLQLCNCFFYLYAMLT